MSNAFSNTNRGTNRGTNAESINKVVNLGMYCHEIKASQAGNGLLSCSLSSKNQDGTYTKSISVTVIADPVKIENLGQLVIPSPIKVSGGIRVSEYKSKAGYTHPTLTIFADSIENISKNN